jgi:hypothetical protein
MVQHETSNDCSPPATPESAIFGVFKLKPFADDTAMIRTAIIDRMEHFMVVFDNDNGVVVASTTIFQILCDVSSSSNHFFYSVLNNVFKTWRLPPTSLQADVR